MGDDWRDDLDKRLAAMDLAIHVTVLEEAMARAAEVVDPVVYRAGLEAGVRRERWVQADPAGRGVEPPVDPVLGDDADYRRGLANGAAYYQVERYRERARAEPVDFCLECGAAAEVNEHAPDCLYPIAP